MKLLADFLPILLFFVAYKIAGIYTATAVAIVTTLLQVGWAHLRHGRVEKMQWITLGLILVLGGLTLALHDPLFIKWKPTVVNWLFAAAFLGAALFSERNLLQRLMGENLELPAAVWQRLNLAWVLFFVLSGAANLYVAFHYPEQTWVNFKLFGMLGLTLLFLLAQGFYLARHLQPGEES